MRGATACKQGSQYKKDYLPSRFHWVLDYEKTFSTDCSFLSGQR